MHHTYILKSISSSSQEITYIDYSSDLKKDYKSTIPANAILPPNTPLGSFSLTSHSAIKNCIKFRTIFKISLQKIFCPKAFLIFFSQQIFAILSLKKNTKNPNDLIAIFHSFFLNSRLIFSITKNHEI